MIRVLQYIGPLLVGGSQSFILEIYRKINKEIIQFDFVTFPGGDDALRTEIEKLGGKIYESPQYKGWNHIQYKRWWNDFFKTHPEYHILHGHVRSVASIYIPIAKKHGLVTIVHSHNTSNGIGIASKIKDLLQLPIRYEADYFFACSEEAGVWLFGNKVVNGERYRFVPNSIDTKGFKYNSKVRDEVRKELNIENRKVIGNIGRVVKPKNQAFLLDILKELLKFDASVCLLLVGDGELLEDLKQKTECLGLDDNVIFTGSRNDVGRMYQAMDVFVFPSIWEGLPVSLVEAQANGLRCIVSNRITKDVKLTARIKYIALERGAEEWASIVRKALEYKRTGIREKDLTSLQKFESYEVANNLKEFYLSV